MRDHQLKRCVERAKLKTFSKIQQLCPGVTAQKPPRGLERLVQIVSLGGELLGAESKGKDVPLVVLGL